MSRPLSVWIIGFVNVRLRFWHYRGFLTRKGPYRLHKGFLKIASSLKIVWLSGNIWSLTSDIADIFSIKHIHTINATTYFCRSVNQLLLSNCRRWRQTRLSQNGHGNLKRWARWMMQWKRFQSDSVSGWSEGPAARIKIWGFCNR